MSILDAMRVQRADNKSVRELAMLPQPEIIKLAQMGQIPADVVPVVISEKARMAQMVANMQAMQSGQQPTVIEQAMQQNANAESQQSGLPGLPTEGMFKEQNFQTGGIVGYNGEEKSEVELDNLVNQQDARYSPRPRTLEELVAQGQKLRDPYLQQSQAEKDYATSLASAKMDPNQMLWMNLLKGGLKAAAGTSPYGLTNLASGLSEAAEGYGKDLESQRKLGLEQAKELAAQGRQSRLDQLSNIASAERLYEKTMDNEAAMTRALKAADISAFADTFVKDEREKGSTKSDTALKLEGQREYLRLRYALDQNTARALAAQTQAGAAVTGAGAQVTAADTTKADKEAQRKLEAQKIEEQKIKAALDRSKERFKDEMDRPGGYRLTPEQKAARKIQIDNEELASSGLPPIGAALPVANTAAPAAPSARGKTGQTYSSADISFTAKKYGITEAEVKQRLGIQ